MSWLKYDHSPLLTGSVGVTGRISYGSTGGSIDTVRESMSEHVKVPKRTPAGEFNTCVLSSSRAEVAGRPDNTGL